MDKKTRPTEMLSPGDVPQGERHTHKNSKGMEKDMQMQMEKSWGSKTYILQNRL